VERWKVGRGNGFSPREGALKGHSRTFEGLSKVHALPNCRKSLPRPQKKKHPADIGKLQEAKEQTKGPKPKG